MLKRTSTKYVYDFPTMLFAILYSCMAVTFVYCKHKLLTFIVSTIIHTIHEALIEFLYFLSETGTS